LSSLEKYFDERKLMDLRKEQIKLLDEVVVDMFRDYIQKQIEEDIYSKLEVMKSQRMSKGINNKGEGGS
jgi:hypothetical protein